MTLKKFLSRLEINIKRHITDIFIMNVRAVNKKERCITNLQEKKQP